MLIIHPAEQGGYWAEVPALDGCFVQGESVEDLVDEAPRAIASHLEALREDGQLTLLLPLPWKKEGEG